MCSTECHSSCVVVKCRGVCVCVCVCVRFIGAGRLSGVRIDELFYLLIYCLLVSKLLRTFVSLCIVYC